MPRLDKEGHVKQAVADAKDKIAASGKRDVLVFDSGHKAAIPGFGLRVFASGAATFILKFALRGGKTRRVALGDVRLAGESNLARMRQWAGEIRDTARVLGKDIYAELEAAVAARQAAERETQDAPTLRKLAPQYLHDRERGRNDNGREIKRLKPKSLVETRRYLEGSGRTASVWEPIADMPLSRINMRDLQGIVESTARANGAVTADRARVALSGFFAWAVALGLVDTNPTNDLETQSLNRARERVLTEAELVEVWVSAGDDEFGKIIKLLMLTACRRAEIGDLAWSEIDLARRVIELPARRCKNNRPHLVPLSDQALAIIKSIPHNETRELIFGTGVGGYSGWSKSKRELDARLGGMASWVLHDLRRSTATHLLESRERTTSRGRVEAYSFALPHVVEAILNHASGHKAGVAGTYNKAAYFAEKRAALQCWADHLTGLAAQSMGADSASRPPPRGEYRRGAVASVAAE